MTKLMRKPIRASLFLASSLGIACIGEIDPIAEPGSPDDELIGTDTLGLSAPTHLYNPLDAEQIFGGGDFPGGDPDVGTGLSDPSFAGHPTIANGLMAYSVVRFDTTQSPTLYGLVETHIAYGSTVSGFLKWTYSGKANQTSTQSIYTTDTTVCGSNWCNAFIIHETPSLLYDAADTQKPYKLYVYTLPIVKLTTGAWKYMREWGYIGLYTSTNAVSWSGETKLIGWNSTSAFSSSGALWLLNNMGTGSHFMVYEPAAVMDPQNSARILLYLGGLRLDSNSSSLAYGDILRFSADNRGTAFAYNHTVLSGNIARSYDSEDMYLGTDAFVRNGQIYVNASTYGPISIGGSNNGKGYRGCFTVPVNGMTGAVGAVTKYVGTRAPSGGPELRFSGACAVLPNGKYVATTIFPESLQNYWRLKDTGIVAP